MLPNKQLFLHKSNSHAAPLATHFCFFLLLLSRIHLYYFNIMNWNDSSEGILCVLLNYWDLIIIKLWQMTYIFIVYFCRCMAKEWNKIQLGSKYCHERALKIYRCYVKRQCVRLFSLMKILISISRFDFIKRCIL